MRRDGDRDWGEGSGDGESRDDDRLTGECSCRVRAASDAGTDASAGQSHLKLDGARNQSIISSWIFVTKCQSD